MEQIKSLEELLKKFNHDELKRISSQIIEAYKNQDRSTLCLFAEKLNLDASENQNNMSLIFKKLIFAFHPDRITHFHKYIRELYKVGNHESLNKLDFSSDHDQARYIMPFTAEDYSYSENDFWEDDFDEYLDGDSLKDIESEEYGFIEAVRNLMYGNLFSEFLPKDLYYLEGVLSLPGESIEDLTGIEYCLNITGLNLEENCIAHLGRISDLIHLTSLYLAHNRIEDIDSLLSLTELQILDLSFNDIEDVIVLNKLPALKYVNLIGNKKISNNDILPLTERCIVLTG